MPISILEKSNNNPIFLRFCWTTPAGKSPGLIAWLRICPCALIFSLQGSALLCQYPCSALQRCQTIEQNLFPCKTFRVFACQSPHRRDHTYSPLTLRAAAYRWEAAPWHQSHLSTTIQGIIQFRLERGKKVVNELAGI